MGTLNCAIIDDEPLARECISNYIKEIDFLELVGSGNNPLELTKVQEKHRLDLIFLDVQMPIMNGIEFLKLSGKRPMVILTTAYPNYALEGFELDVLDYLLKPITFNRFFKAAKKAWDYHRLANPDQEESLLIKQDDLDYFFVKCDYIYERIYLKDILFVEAMQNYVSFHTTDQKKHLVLMSLKKVEERLDPHTFLRVHKSYIVSVAKVDAIADNKINILSHQIPMGRSYRYSAMEHLLKNKVWKK